MNFKLGDLVTRISHKHDIVFKIVGIDNNVVYLKGVDIRLYADSYISDLVSSENVDYSYDKKVLEESIRDIKLDRGQYFYLPGTILHIDGDEDYLERCMSFYKNMNIKANGIAMSEFEIADRLPELLNEFRPDILVITGHDAYLDGKTNDYNRNYQNTASFIEAVKAARRYEKSHDKLLIIAGACQSNYEELIKAGANFASSPKRINIHALDPAIVASSLAFSNKNQSIDVIKIIEKTKYGSDGIGGIITNGTMYVGYPR